MIDRLDEIIDSMGNESENTEQPTSTPDTTASTESNTSTEVQSTEDNQNVEQNTNTQPSNATEEQASNSSTATEAQSSATETPKQEGSNNRNKNKYTHEEQVAYAFNKLNSKFSRTKKDLAEALKQIEELKKAQAARPPVNESKALGPESFSSQEEYFKYIANQSIIEQLQKAAEQKRSNDAQSQALKESQDRFNSKALEIYNTPEAIEEYNTVVGKAINEDGLADTISNDPVIHDFLNSSNIAPRLVYHFAAIPEDLERITAIKDPTDKRFALNILQHKIQTVFSNMAKQAAPNSQPNSQPASNNSQPSSVPIVGKAGTGGASSAGTTELSMDDVMANLRSHIY